MKPRVARQISAMAMPPSARGGAEQIAHVLKRVESGVGVGEVCCEMGITEATFYRWKQEFGGLSTPESRELRQLRDENRRLTGAVTDLALDRTMLQEALRKEW